MEPQVVLFVYRFSFVSQQTFLVLPYSPNNVFTLGVVTIQGLRPGVGSRWSPASGSFGAHFDIGLVPDLPRCDAVLILSRRSCQGDVFRWLVQRSCQRDLL
jgi:hypothetical protein